MTDEALRDTSPAINLPSQQGLAPFLVMGAPVSENDLSGLDNKTDFPMPPELRQFYLEVGDGFAFVPNDSDASKLVGWEYMHLADHKIWNKGFGNAVQGEAMREIGKSLPNTNSELLAQEVARRKLWMPFYGFVGGGDVLCLDLSMNPPAVRFHEALSWVALAETWDFLLATSFTEFVERWSRFHFVSPPGGWTSFCRGCSGRFEWAPRSAFQGSEGNRALNKPQVCGRKPA